MVALVRCKAVFLLAVLSASPVFAQSVELPGEQFHIAAEDLPAPLPGSGAFNPPDVVPRRAIDAPLVPEGFEVNLFAEGLSHPRWMLVAPNGDIILAESSEGQLTLLRDADGDGVAELVTPFARGYQRPHGMAFHGGDLYVADQQAVWRLPYQYGATEGRGRVPVTDQGALGPPNGHWTRNIVFAPNAESFFVAIGSRRNIDEEPEPRATVQRFDADGGNQITFAGGLRNPVGIAFHPDTDELYVVVNERDGYGDDLVPDFLTRVQQGEFYGWPYAYLGPHADPEFGDRRPDLVEITSTPDVLFQAHSAPIGLVFYDGPQFPETYHGDAFVAFRGSWNRGEPTGYKIVRVPFENGRPTGGYENFATGFWRAGDTQAEVFGRPTGLAIAADGSLLIADDAGRAVWRVSYVGD